MLPAGPLSMTTFGEMLSSRQPFSVSPSDSTRELVPVTAKIAMRKSGPITTPVSLTSRNGESASLAEDGVSVASLRISGAAGSTSAGGWCGGATNGCDAYYCRQLIGRHPRSDTRLSLLFSRVLLRV